LRSSSAAMRGISRQSTDAEEPPPPGSATRQPKSSKAETFV
jgi:hypothetical protein